MLDGAVREQPGILKQEGGEREREIKKSERSGRERVSKKERERESE